MKLKRSLQPTTMMFVGTAIVACILFVGGLTGWSNYSTEAALRWPGAAQRFAIAPVCCIVGAVGVVGLGWYWLRLAGAITSIARRLKSKRPMILKQHRNTIVKELDKVINNVIENDANYIKTLEKQVKDLKIQTQLSQRQKRNTEAIIYSIRDAVIVIDEFGRLLMANEAAGKLFNFDFNSSKYKAIAELLHPDIDEHGEFVNFLRQSRENKARATRREIAFLTEAGAGTYDCIVSCVYDRKENDAASQKVAKSQAEQVCGLVAVLHDITREKEISQMKSDFVSHVSHELKTPLASISAYSEMLLDGEAKDKQMQKEFYEVIQGQAKRLNRLIEDILNISRIESGLIKVEKKPVSLTILIEEQLQMIKGYADEKNIRIIRQKPIVLDQAYVDKDMISQVIVNLLSNAVKYTPPEGSIKIETEVDDTANLVRVSITDTGVGIGKDEVEHVFDKFYRASANKSSAKGTGLGLNLVKQIVEKVHNGRVFVVSQPGVGSTFGFELPLAAEKTLEVTTLRDKKENFVEAE